MIIKRIKLRARKSQTSPFYINNFAQHFNFSFKSQSKSNYCFLLDSFLIFGLFLFFRVCFLKAALLNLLLLLKHLLSHEHQRITHHGLPLFGVFVGAIHPRAIIPKFTLNFRVDVQTPLPESALGEVLARLARMVILTLGPLKFTIGPMAATGLAFILDLNFRWCGLLDIFSIIITIHLLLECFSCDFFLKSLCVWTFPSFSRFWLLNFNWPKSG